MANFTTHIAVGIVVSGAAATLTLAANVVSPAEILTLAMTGALGSVLPDIDLQKSRPSQAIFLGLGIFLAFAVLFKAAYQLSIAEMWLIWLATFFGVRFAGHNIFHRIAEHRGIFHSVLAAVFFATLTAITYVYAFNYHPALAWLGGGFMFIGYITHLILDEIYSVDVYNERIKASFGTALKLIDMHRPYASAAMGAALALAIWMAPSPMPFVTAFQAVDVRSMIHDRFLPPDQNWFGITDDLTQIAANWMKKS